VKQYFTEDRVLAGLFDVIQRLYGLQVQPDSAPVWHPDVRFYRLVDASGALVGQFYLDLYAREGKRGGAWMDDCRNRRDRADGVQTPLVYLVCNFGRGTDGKPATFSHNEVTTLFHEMGHGLHQLLTRVGELGVAGINGVEWDAVELPSQFMENFCWEWERVQAMTAHVDTGEPLPRALFDRMLAAKNYQSGMFTVRQLEFGLFDMLLHTGFDRPGKACWNCSSACATRCGEPPAVMEPLPAPVQPHLRRRLCGRLLQLQVGRGAQRRCLRRVRGTARCPGRHRRALPGRGAGPGRQPQRGGELPRLPRSRAEDRRAAAP
jgi:Zn-dependent oligopeptidases